MANDLMLMLLKNVRLSYPSLFQRAVFNGQAQKFSADFLLERDDPVVKEIRQKFDEIMKGANVKIASDRVCLKEYDDQYYTLRSASNNRPVLLNPNRSPMTEDENLFYGGCYVNAKIGFWLQNNSYGKRINSNLYAVQFVKDGERFGGLSHDVIMDGFTEIDVSDDWDPLS